jgi:hypothetical protein
VLFNSTMSLQILALDLCRKVSVLDESFVESNSCYRALDYSFYLDLATVPADSSLFAIKIPRYRCTSDIDRSSCFPSV